MMLPQIRWNHHPNNKDPFTFFILAKGDNAGKPCTNPWDNTFYVRCNNQEAFEFYFWLIHGLHLVGKFRRRHPGSAAPFIKLQDIRDQLRIFSPVMFQEWQKFKAILAGLEQRAGKTTTLRQLLASTQMLQRRLIDRHS